MTDEEKQMSSNFFRTSDDSFDSYENSISAYNRLLKDNYLYSSNSQQNKNTDSSFALLKNASIIRILKFVIFDNQAEYVICNLLNKTDNNIIESYKPLKEMTFLSDEAILVLTNDLLKVCINIKIAEKLYISELPNPYSLYV